MMMDLLGDLANIMHGPTILTLKASTCNTSMNIHFPRVMIVSSALLTLDLLDTCTLYKLLSL